MVLVELIEMHHTPTYSSWLNQIEIWFNILSKDILNGAVWHSKQQLVDQLMNTLKHIIKKGESPLIGLINLVSVLIKRLLH